jgi:hypothetical protein
VSCAAIKELRPGFNEELNQRIKNVNAPRRFPSKLAMARNAGKAVGQVIIHGAKKVSDEEQARRLAICKVCEFYRPLTSVHFGDVSRCAHPKCGCFLKLKTRLEGWHCPISKW